MAYRRRSACTPDSRPARQVALWTLVIVIGMFPGVGVQGAGSLAQPPKPNVILVVADDLGYGDLGCYGQKTIQTPQMDRLADEGIRFTDCYAGAATGVPSQCVLMTGRNTGHCRVRGASSESGREGAGVLDPLDVTLGELMRAAGYETAMVGKWALGAADSTGAPWRQGFDQFFGSLEGGDTRASYPVTLWHNDQPFPIKGNADGAKGEYSPDLFVEFAFRFILKQREKPFFLQMALPLPQEDHEVPNLSPYDAQPWEERAKVHAAMIHRLDRSIGQLITLLNTATLTDKTLLIVTSDNGAARRWEGLFESAGPWRGKKGELYEGGLRVPMILRWPGWIPEGSVSGHPWTFEDLFPTLAELTSVPPPDGLTGRSILHMLLGMPTPPTPRRFYWEHHGPGAFQQAMRWGRWKAILPGRGRVMELYDLANDPGETRNLGPRLPQVINRFEVFFRTSRTDSELWPVPEGARGLGN